MPRITITAENQSPQPYRFSLDREIVTFGRGDENDIEVDCGSVSLKHAAMQRVVGGYELKDLGSTNGIKLNGEYRDVIELSNDQSILLGDVVFDFVLSEDELIALAAEAPVTHKPKLPPIPQMQWEMPHAEVGGPEPDAPEYVDPQAASAVQVRVEAEVSHAGLNSLACILAVIAFVAGMAVHFQQETGESMLGVVHERLTGAGDIESSDAISE